MIETNEWNEIETLRARVLVLEAALAESRSPLLQDAAIAHIVRTASRAYELAGERFDREARLVRAVGQLQNACHAAQPYVRGELRRLSEHGIPTTYAEHVVGAIAEAIDVAESLTSELSRDAAR